MKILKKPFLFVLLSLLLLAASPVSASTVTSATAETQPELRYNVYMQLEGIEGESAAKDYEKWIVLSGVYFDITNDSSNSGAGGAAGKAVLNEFVVTKPFDVSSVPIFLNAATGKHLKKGKIVFATRGESSTPLLTIELNDVTISNYDFNNTSETISLQFSSIQLSYSIIDSKGSKAPPIYGGFDFTHNKVQP
ncbi:Hcp family type VI secretion system effector [Paenibacillus piri]|nr:type VI secretion system tube protein Hcp [Paenibacillus piri]